MAIMATKRPLDDVEAQKESASKKAKVQDSAEPGDASQEDQERAVGINVYVSPEVPGFQCVVKQRYTDFLVNEIPLSSEVLHLTDVPDGKSAEPAKSGKENDESNATQKLDQPMTDVANGDDSGPVEAAHANGEATEDVNAAVPELSRDDRSLLHSILGDDVTDKIVNLNAAIFRRPDKKPRDHPTVKSNVISEKSKRTEAHKAIRQIFDSRLQTETMQDEVGVIAIKAAPTKAAARARGQHMNNGTAKGKLGWDELGGEYLHFTLHKENRDTMEALSFIASQLKIPAKNFEFAGTKDRRGVTVQKIALFRVRAERIAALNRMAKGWRAGGFEYKKQGLAMGDLVGNEFTLTLRDCHFAGEDGLDGSAKVELARKAVEAAAKSFMSRGYLNYYGLQRFGTFSTGTHVTGMKMLQGDLEGAVNSILTYHPSLLPENVGDQATDKIPRDDIARADCIQQWREGKIGAQQIRDMMPRRFSAEGGIMQYLSKKDKKTGHMPQASDWQGALMQIQRGLRLMYVHAYQSLVWNVAAGKRWELYGDKVVEGDLVIVGEKDGNTTNGTKDEVDQDGEVVVRPTGEDSGPAEDSFTRARPLSKAEAESGKYTTFDIVLPQPGFDVLYPANEVGRFYEEFMGSKEGGELDPHSMRRSWKDASLSGSYRKMMARPLNGVVEWEVKEYVSAEEQMVETDLEKLGKLQQVQDGVVANAFDKAGRGSAENANDVPLGARSSGDVQEGDVAGLDVIKKIAVVMKFQLGSSQYATMALRELTKGGAKAYKPDFNTAR